MIVSGSGPSSRMLPARTYSMPLPLALVEDARLHDALFDRLADTAGAAHGVDRAHVVMVPAFDRRGRFRG